MVLHFSCMFIYNPINFSIAPGASVQSFTVEVTSATCVQLSWLPPDPQLWNGVITNYTVVYELLGPVGMTSDNSSHSVMTKTIPTQDSPLANNADPRDVSFPLHWERVAIEGLHEHHVYKFSVFMANAAGRSGMTMTIIQGLPGAGRVVMTLHTFPGGYKVCYMFVSLMVYSNVFET